MHNAQFFKAPDGSEFAILPRADYDALIAAKYDGAVRRSTEARRPELPPEVVQSIARGGNPVKVLRCWRAMSQQELANSVNLSKSYLSRIENGWLAPGTKTRRTIAEKLGVPEHVLSPRPDA
jgi:ribosome-binding protein aMBF1 (putative translation factor)